VQNIAASLPATSCLHLTACLAKTCLCLLSSRWRDLSVANKRAGGDHSAPARDENAALLHLLLLTLKKERRKGNGRLGEQGRKYQWAVRVAAWTSAAPTRPQREEGGLRLEGKRAWSPHSRVPAALPRGDNPRTLPFTRVRYPTPLSLANFIYMFTCTYRTGALAPSTRRAARQRIQRLLARFGDGVLLVAQRRNTCGARTFCAAAACKARPARSAWRQTGQTCAGGRAAVEQRWTTTLPSRARA